MSVVQLATTDPHTTVPDDPVSLRVLESHVSISTKSTRVSIPLGDFRVAQWWKIRYKVPPEDNRLFLDSIRFVEWVVTDSSRIGKVDTLRIHSILFKNSHNFTFLWASVALFLVVCLLFAMFLLKKRVQKTSHLKSIEVAPSLQPRPIVVEPSDWQRILSLLENSYCDPELDLPKLANKTGISESKLSLLINEHHAGGFRSLVHDFRAQEAKRLLKETDLNIAEIAYKLGYATPSHFNREFKQREGNTPSAFRTGQVP